jgi:carbon starvation protein
MGTMPEDGTRTADGELDPADEALPPASVDDAVRDAEER